MIAMIFLYCVLVFYKISTFAMCYLWFMLYAYKHFTVYYFREKNFHCSPLFESKINRYMKLEQLFKNEIKIVSKIVHFVDIISVISLQSIAFLVFSFFHYCCIPRTVWTLCSCDMFSPTCVWRCATLCVIYEYL